MKQPTASPPRGRRALEGDWERFLLTGNAPTSVRPEIAASWWRCRQLGVPAEHELAPIDIGDELADYRDQHPMAAVMPLVRGLLLPHAQEEGLVVAVGDRAGRLLWVEGAVAALRQAERMNFVEGSRWDESGGGTSAPALALATDAPARIRSAEHFNANVHRWSCSAAPLHDPQTGELLGVIDVTGDERAASKAVLALVCATVAAAEAELRLAQLGASLRAGTLQAPTLRRPSARTRPLPADAPTRLELDVLGRRDGFVTVHAQRSLRRTRLSPRHAEILLVLAGEPGGLSTEELAVRLDVRTLDTVTIRAELTRLRRVLGSQIVLSRPYRLAIPLDTDAADVHRMLGRGARRAAMRRYLGPVLPRSEAPYVVELREQLHAELRQALLGAPDSELLTAVVESPWGADDLDCWRALHACLPAGSPRKTQAAARLRLLDEELAAG
jgi:hypothetical protein